MDIDFNNLIKSRLIEIGKFERMLWIEGIQEAVLAINNSKDNLIKIDKKATYYS